VLLQTIALYFVAAMVLPEKVGTAGVDLRVQHEKHKRWLFGFPLAAVIVSVAKDVILYRRFALPENLAFHAFFAISCVSAMLVPGGRFNVILAIMAALLIGAYVAILFARLH
jgi:hypothetical protein